MINRIETTNTNEIKSIIQKFSYRKKLFVCGITPLGETMVQWLTANGIPVFALVDRRGKCDWTDKKVYVYEELKAFDLSECVFVVTQNIFKKEVVNDLRRVHISDDNIMIFESMKEFDAIAYELKSKIKTDKMVTDSLKGRHAGERCFIVGNGPSLTFDDIKMIRYEKTFAMNLIYKNLRELNWKPTYYFVTDRTMGEDFAKSNDEMKCLLENVGLAFFDIKTRVFDVYSDSRYSNLLFFRTFEKGNKVKRDDERFFSSDIVDGAFRSGTVTYVAMQFAAYMGFEKIYLLGVDFNYKQETDQRGNRIRNEGMRSNHAEFITEPEWYDQDAYEPVEEMLFGYKTAKKYADAHNIGIYNATRGGKLEIFPRVNFDTLFSN